MSEVANMETYFSQIVRVKEAVIRNISVKTNTLGISVATLKIEVESDNPERDFEWLLNLQRQYVTLIVRGEKVRTADL